MFLALLQDPTTKLWLGGVLSYHYKPKLSFDLSTGCVGDIWRSGIWQLKPIFVDYMSLQKI